MRPRSIVPGRQRWEVDHVRGRPAAARLAQTALLQAPGIEEVHVNPVTGRVLVRHVRTLGAREVAQLLRRAVEWTLAALRSTPADVRGLDSARQPKGTDGAGTRHRRTGPHSSSGAGHRGDGGGSGR
ncbi:hypothetical protein ACPXCX_47065, partial [Streptomyces sp. DT225]